MKSLLDNSQRKKIVIILSKVFETKKVLTVEQQC